MIDRRTVNTDSDYQLDVGSSADIISSKYLIADLQSQARSGPANRANNITIFDHLDIKKYFIEINSVP